MREPWVTAIWSAFGGLLAGFISILFFEWRSYESSWASHILLLAGTTIGGFLGGWNGARKQLEKKEGPDG